MLLALRCILAGNEHCAAPLATDRDSLDDAKGDQTDRRPDPDLCVGGEESDAYRGDTHHHQGDDESVLASDPVAEVTEDDPADRPGEEACPECDEGEESCDSVRESVGEEDVAEYQGSGSAVDVEVVPLDSGSDERSDTGLFAPWR